MVITYHQKELNIEKIFFFMDSLCVKCKGKGLCGKPCKILFNFMENVPKFSTHFSGPSPPEIFVGRIGYPNVNTGILAPTNFETKHAEFKNASDWSKNNLSIANVLRLRGQLIYGRGISNIKKSNSFKEITKELALTHKPTSVEFFLKKKPVTKINPSSVFMPMTNPAPIQKAILQENTKVLKKVDYLVNDSNAKATNAIHELYTSKIDTEHLQKLLSIGALGQKTQRKLVPTRWSITAIDDIVSKRLLDKVRYYKELNEICLYKGSYLGNYIEILFLPGIFSFEAIEIWMDSSLYSEKKVYAVDFETFNGRKDYAKNITGGYYAMRLPVVEYLDKIKRQATVLVIRKITEEYYAPLGVGIVRETTRRALNNNPESFDSLKQALEKIEFDLKENINTLIEKSYILKNYGKQKSLNTFFN